MADLFLALVVTAMAVIGYRRGALVSALGMASIVVGGFVGMLFGSFGSDNTRIIATIVGGGLGGLAFAMRAAAVEERVDDLFDGNAVRQVDRALGGALNVMFGLVMIWFIGVVLTLTDTQAGLGEAMRTSRSVEALLSVVSPTSDAAALIIRAGLVPALSGPLVIVDEPDDAALDAAAVHEASESVVQIRGEACNSITTGTGWVVAPNLVVTNAHVVAGLDGASVLVGGREPGISARIVAFDPLNDLAVLATQGLNLKPLARNATPAHGASGVIIGYPRRDGLVFNAARFDRSVPFAVRDIYEATRQETDIAVFRGDVRPGSSGSPVVDTSGRVMATVSASAEGQVVAGGYGIPERVLASVLIDLKPNVSSGPCLAAEAGTARPL